MKNQIQSGIGDNHDLLVKMPTEENQSVPFKQGAKLKGTVDKKHTVYPPIHFDLGVQYEGKVIDTYNEGEFEVGIEAQPEVCVNYTVKQEKELPIERAWETEAKFEAEVDITEMEYATTMHGSYLDKVNNPLRYNYHWIAQKVTNEVMDAAGILASGKASSSWIGSSSKENQYRVVNGALIDDHNLPYIAGVIAKDHMNMKNVEIYYSFTPLYAVLPTTDTSVDSAMILDSRVQNSSGAFVRSPGFDDDLIGFVFNAKSTSNFYCMLWEGHKRAFLGSRPPNTMDGATINDAFWHTVPGIEVRKNVPSPDYHESFYGFSRKTLTSNPFTYQYKMPTAETWKHFNEKTGWRSQHRRIYRVKNGVFKRVDVNPSYREGGLNGYDPKVSDLGDGYGWMINEERKVRIVSVGKKFEIFVTKVPGSETFGKIFELEVDNDGVGTYGVLNVSQAVKFHHIKSVSRELVEGFIPQDEGKPYYEVKDGTQTVTQKKLSFIRSRIDFKNKVQAIGGNPDTINITRALVVVQQGAPPGSVVSNSWEIRDEPVVIKAVPTQKEWPFTVRIPSDSSKWEKWKGIGTKEIASSGVEMFKAEAEKYIKNNMPLISDFDASRVLYSVVEGSVKDPTTGRFNLNGVNPNQKIVIETFNPPDAGEILTARHIHCDVQEVTPDHRDKDSCVTVFSDIKSHFLEKKLEFFKRKDLINKKEEYNLLIPEEQTEPEQTIIKPNDLVVTEGGCTSGSEEEIEEVCWKDFEFDGKSLCMWSCEFPVEVNVRDFKACFAKYEGEKTFWPLNEFNHNKWSKYEIFYNEAELDHRLDKFSWSQSPLNTTSYDHIVAKTERRYIALMDEEDNTRVSHFMTTDEGENIVHIEIPPAPERFIHPIRRKEQMGNYETPVHFFMRIYEKHPDIVLSWARFDPDYDEFIENLPYIEPTEDGLYRLNRLKEKASAGIDIETGLEIIEETNRFLDFNYKIRAIIKDSIKARDWNSGLRKISLFVNGKAPLIRETMGKNDLSDVDLMFVDFPPDIIHSTIKGPKVVVIPRNDLNPPNSELDYEINGDKATFTSNTTTQMIEKVPYETAISYKNNQNLFADKEEKEIYTISSNLTSSIGNNPSIPSTFELENIEFYSDNPFVMVYPLNSKEKWVEASKESKSFNLEVGAKLKESYPMKWNPLIHNGYYYMKDEEHYLYAQLGTKAIQQLMSRLSNRPQQGSPVIVSNNKGSFLKRIDSYESHSLETREDFITTRSQVIYLKEDDINHLSLKVYIEGSLVSSSEYLFDSINSSIEFYQKVEPDQFLSVTYKRNNSFSIDMNPDRGNYSSYSKDSKIELSSDVLLQDKYEAAFESAENTPFYREEEILLNPLYGQKSNGFIYISDEEQIVHRIKIYNTHDFINNKESKALIKFYLEDEDGARIPNRRIKVSLQGQINYNLTTDQSGSAQLLFEKSNYQGLASYIHVYAESDNVFAHEILDITVDNHRSREAIVLESEKVNYSKNEDVYLKLKVLDYNLNKVTSTKSVSVTYYDKTTAKTVISSFAGEGLVSFKAPSTPGEYKALVRMIGQDDNAINIYSFRVQ